MSASASSSPLWPTLIGAGAAIVGGFIGAWFQTNRADDVAREIRREERREQALQALQFQVGQTVDQVAEISKAAIAQGQTVFQYAAALKPLRALSELWLWQSTSAISEQSDPGIVRAYKDLDADVRERLPTVYTTDKLPTSPDKLLADLDHVLALLRTLRSEVKLQVDGLLRPSPPWWRFRR
jgi:hypothetical protein